MVTSIIYIIFENCWNNSKQFAGCYVGESMTHEDLPFLDPSSLFLLDDEEIAINPIVSRFGMQLLTINT